MGFRTHLSRTHDTFMEKAAYQTSGQWNLNPKHPIPPKNMDPIEVEVSTDPHFLNTDPHFCEYHSGPRGSSILTLTYTYIGCGQ